MLNLQGIKRSDIYKCNLKAGSVQSVSSVFSDFSCREYKPLTNISLQYFTKVSFRQNIENNFKFDFEAEPIVLKESQKLYEVLNNHFNKEQKLITDPKKLASLKANHISLLEDIYSTLKFAYYKHKGQFREGGEPYIVHPIGVAKIVCDNGNFNMSTIKAALLHDVVEDTGTSLEEIKDRFGLSTSIIVDGVTKIERKFENKQEKEDHNLAKIMLAVADEPRVAFVKLADRIYNMRTMDAMPKEKQRAKAEETLRIFIPLAERLGMKSSRVELENLVLKYHNEDNYILSTNLFEERTLEAKTLENNLKATLYPLFKKSRINADISLQPKSYYRVFKKHERGDKLELADFYSIKLIVPTNEDCYKALRILTEKYTILDGSIKYYIKNPKENLYKSLHARIVTDNNQIQVQIRTPEMQRYIENGFSVFLQDKKDYSSKVFKLSWIENIRDYKRLISSEPEKIANYLEKDILSPQIHVVTNDHTTIDMPKGSTVIDFAFRTNTANPWNISEAKINGKSAQLDQVLKKGDIVAIKYSNSQNDLGQLANLVRSQYAKDLIRKKQLEG